LGLPVLSQKFSKRATPAGSELRSSACSPIEVLRIETQQNGEGKFEQLLGKSKRDDL
jgi:hypothetical protein